MSRKTVWNRKRENAIIKSIENGASFKKAAKAAGICYDTLRERAKTNSAFSDRIKKAKELQIQTVEDALFKTAAGLIDRIEETHEHIRIGKKKTPAVLVRTVKKKLAPNVAAQIFYLGNRDPENWKNVQYSKLSGHIGVNINAADIWKAREEADKEGKHEGQKKKKKKRKRTKDANAEKKKKSGKAKKKKAAIQDKKNVG